MSKPGTAPYRAFLRAAMLFLALAAGCHGGARNDWLRDAISPDAQTSESLAWIGGDTQERASAASSPFGALVSGLFGKNERSGTGHARIEPAPILGEHEVGFGFTVHW